VILSLESALEQLGSPDVHENYSALLGAPVMVVDLSRVPSAIEPGTIAWARSVLARLPCPTVALAEPGAPAAAALAPAFDVHLDSARDLEPILDTVCEARMASLALVQLLRVGEALELEAALLAESFVYSMLQSGPDFRRWLERRTATGPSESNCEPAVRVRRDGDRLELTLNRPERRNALSAEMRDALVEALQVARCDPSVREILLAGAGPDFCSGGDLAEFGTAPDPVSAHAIRSTRNPARLLGALSGRVRAELHGACVGAGVELPAFAARVVARPDTTFWLPELSMGLVPGAGGTVSVPRRIGRQRAAGWMLSGNRIDARTALAWGLVDELGD
jgi:Enoyl-CoA hydratase/isomerase